MAQTRVLLVFPGSLFGGPWAEGPRVKPELVTLSGEVRHAGFAVDVLDLEVELGAPDDDAARDDFLRRAQDLLAARPADLVVVSCRTALQYSSAMAVGQAVRLLQPQAALAGDRDHRVFQGSRRAQKRPAHVCRGRPYGLYCCGRSSPR